MRGQGQKSSRAEGRMEQQGWRTESEFQAWQRNWGGPDVNSKLFGDLVPNL